MMLMARENASDADCPAKSERFFRSQRIASLDIKVFSGREIKLTFECAVFSTSGTPELNLNKEMLCGKTNTEN